MCRPASVWMHVSSQLLIDAVYSINITVSHCLSKWVGLPAHTKYVAGECVYAD